MSLQPSHSQTPAPSEWVRRHAALLAPGSRVLDLACGTGRHARLLRGLGHRVVAVDRDAQALASIEGEAGIETLCADLEAAPWPFSPQSFDAVVVTNYLHRPLFDFLRAALREGGVLVYETFALGNERYGRPSNPAFLLRRDELLSLVAPLQVVAFEQGVIHLPKTAVVQRICAVLTQEPVDLPGGSQVAGRGALG
jgi:SAM-dependent methyltransferase